MLVFLAENADKWILYVLITFLYSSFCYVHSCISWVVFLHYYRDIIFFRDKLDLIYRDIVFPLLHRLNSYTMTQLLYGIFPSPLVAIFELIISSYTHERMCNHSKLNHSINDCQVKNNSMRHEEGKDVDSTGKKKACTKGVTFGCHQKWGSPWCYCCLIWNLLFRVLLSLSHCPHVETIVGATVCKSLPPPSGHCLPASAGDSAWTDVDGG